MTTTMTTTSDRISRPEAKVLALDEFTRFADLMASLTEAEWALPTDCTGWDVRKVALHVLGSGDAQVRRNASHRQYDYEVRNPGFQHIQHDHRQEQ